MTGINTAIELTDQITGPLMNIVNAINLTVSAFTDMQSASAGSVDTASLEGARDQANAAAAAVRQLNEALGAANGITPGTASLTPPEPIQPQWQTPQTIEVFQGTGMERYTQEIADTNRMLDQLAQRQQEITNSSAQMDIMPDNAIADIQAVDGRIQAMIQRINTLEFDPIDDSGAEAVNRELERLRQQLSTALQAQTDLSDAMQDMDVGRANEAYERLNSAVDSTDRHIRDNINAQDRFNNEVRESSSLFSGLTGKVFGLIGAYASLRGASSALKMSDTISQTTARLDIMNDGLQTTEDLQNMIYLSAQRSRGAYQSTADAVSKLGSNAGDAFDSSAEIIAFSELLNKQFTIAGTEAAGIDAAMLQLTQAMGAGVLRGEEYNSVLEQAPNIIQSIADYLDVPKGKLKEMAGEGMITADIVKNAMFAAAEETNRKFEQMPRTFSQAFTEIKNNALVAFTPILNKLNELSNSGAMDGFINGVTMAMSMVSSVVVRIFELVASVAGFISTNWSIIEPIIWGVIAALTVYYGRLVLIKAIEIASAIVTGIMTAAKIAMSLATWATTNATWAQAAAQHGLNAAMYACPIVWIIMAIIALIAIIFAVAAAIAKMTGVANSAFGVITGGINVVIQFFKNLGLEVANVALGIWEAMGAIANNIREAFKEALGKVQGFFYNLASVAMEVIGKIADSLSKLPFIEFDASGLVGKADEFAAKAAEASSYTAQYEDVSAAFDKGYSTYETFQDGWVQDAFNSGAAWGDGVTDKVNSLLDEFKDGLPSEDDYPPPPFGNEGLYEGIPENIADTAGNTGSMKEAMEINGEELKYLRDLAEQEVINRFTTAELKVEFTANNNINSNMDLDGIGYYLEDVVFEALESAAEGVH